MARKSAMWLQSSIYSNPANENYNYIVMKYTSLDDYTKVKCTNRENSPTLCYECREMSWRNKIETI